MRMPRKNEAKETMVAAEEAGQPAIGDVDANAMQNEATETMVATKEAEQPANGDVDAEAAQNEEAKETVVATEDAEQPTNGDVDAEDAQNKEAKETVVATKDAEQPASGDVDAEATHNEKTEETIGTPTQNEATPDTAPMADQRAQNAPRPGQPVLEPWLQLENSALAGVPKPDRCGRCGARLADGQCIFCKDLDGIAQ